MTYKTIKSNYDKHLWNDKMVAVAVKKGVITAEEYHEITGKVYISKGRFQRERNYLVVCITTQ